MLVVADASPLVGLVKIGHADVLAALYGTVVIPPRVAAELANPKRPAEVREFMACPPPAPTSMLRAIGSGPGSKRQTRPSTSAVAQTEPAPTAMPSSPLEFDRIVWPGRFMRGRHTHGFYRLMGLDACVAADPDDYVERALRLAADRSWRHEVTRALLDRAPALYNRTDAIRALENALLDAARRRGLI